MSLTINNLDRQALEINVHGQVDRSDYKTFVPIAEERIKQHGHLNLLVNVSDMQGYSMSALWEDLKFDAKHYRDVSRLALVGEDESKKWLATLAKPFTAAEVQFYPQARLEVAREWVRDSR